MTAEHQDFLKANYHHWELYRKDKIIKHYDIALRKKLQEVALTIDPKAIFCLHCNDDAANMLQFVYLQYDKIATVDPITIEDDEEIETIVRKATFPKHKRKG